MTVKASATRTRKSRATKRAGRPDASRGLQPSEVADQLAGLPLADQRFAFDLVRAFRDVSAEQAIDASEVRRHVHRLVEAATLQERRAPRARRELARALGPSLADIDPVPYATIEQARRLAELRTSLLRSGAYPTAAIAEAKGITTTNARQWISRHRQAGRLFTVALEGETLVPAFLLDGHVEPRPEARAAITASRSAGEDGWALWAWFATPSSWLGGRVPAEVLLTEPGVVAEAARQRAATVE